MKITKVLKSCLKGCCSGGALDSGQVIKLYLLVLQMAGILLLVTRMLVVEAIVKKLGVQKNVQVILLLSSFPQYVSGC